MRKYFLIALCLMSQLLLCSEQAKTDLLTHKQPTTIESLKIKLSNQKKSSINNSTVNIVLDTMTVTGGLTGLGGAYFQSTAATIIGSLVTMVFGSSKIAFNCISCCQNNTNVDDQD